MYEAGTRDFTAVDQAGAELTRANLTNANLDGTVLARGKMLQGNWDQAVMA
jgi:uncharacterized protein YjbI with pentapeptide repeats